MRTPESHTRAVSPHTGTSGSDSDGEKIVFTPEESPDAIPLSPEAPAQTQYRKLSSETLAGIFANVMSEQQFTQPAKANDSVPRASVVELVDDDETESPIPLSPRAEDDSPIPLSPAANGEVSPIPLSPAANGDNSPIPLSPENDPPAAAFPRRMTTPVQAKYGLQQKDQTTEIARAILAQQNKGFGK